MSTGGTGETEEPTSRRTLLASIGGATLTALTGCLDGDNETDNTSPDGSNETPGRNEEESGAGDGREERPDIEFTTPDTVHIDEAVPVKIAGLPSGSVEVVVTTSDHEQTEWTARATYETAVGTLDLAEATPVDRDIDAGAANLLQQANSETEGQYAANWNTGDTVTVSIVEGDRTLASTRIDRTYGNVTWERADSDEFVGWLSEPPGEESLPGVIVLHGSGGQPARRLAQMLGANGFAALALQYFEWGNEEELLPGRLVEVPLEFVESGAEWLLDRDRVEGSQVGVWGGSKGGELALLVGSRFDAIGPVVSVNGSGYIWGNGIQGTSQWTYDDEPLAYVPFTTDAEVRTGPAPQELKPAYKLSLEEASDDTLAEATIPVEKCDGPVLLVSGGDDKLLNSVELHNVAAERLDENGHEYEHLVYEDAGHAIRYPYLPATNREESKTHVYGGTAAGYAKADADHWPRVLETFETLRNE